MCWKSSLTFWEVAAYFQGRLLLNLQGVDFLSPNFSCQRRAPRSGIAVPKKIQLRPGRPLPRKHSRISNRRLKLQTLQLSFLLAMACLKKKKCFMKQTSLDVPNSYSHTHTKSWNFNQYLTTKNLEQPIHDFFQTHHDVCSAFKPSKWGCGKKKKTENPGVDSHPFFRGVAP